MHKAKIPSLRIYMYSVLDINGPSRGTIGGGTVYQMSILTIATLTSRKLSSRLVSFFITSSLTCYNPSIIIGTYLYTYIKTILWHSHPHYSKRPNLNHSLLTCWRHATFSSLSHSWASLMRDITCANREDIRSEVCSK
jgi:hypothetical protein